MRVFLVFSLLLMLVPAVGVAASKAGPLSCSGGVASNPSFDPTGTSGAVGDFTLNCSGGTPGSPVPLTFDYFLNAAVLAPGSWTLTDGVHNYSGVLAAPNDVEFKNVPFSPPGSSSQTWTVENIFVNPSLYPGGFQFDEFVSASLPVAGAQQWVATNGPLTLLNFRGGLSSAPVPLPAGQLVGEVTGSIGGSEPQDYYSFYWSGGPFSATASIIGAPGGASYLFSEGGAGSCSSGASATLNSADSFASTIGADLASGQYCIGISANELNDPNFALTFNTPVTDEAPEPSGFVLLSIGLGMAGVLRLRKRSGGGFSGSGTSR